MAGKEGARVEGRRAMGRMRVVRGWLLARIVGEG